MFSKKNLSMIIVSVFCLISLARAEEGKSESKIDLIPVYEKTFDDTIQHVVFDEVEVTVEQAKHLGRNYVGYNKNEKIKMLFPKVIVTKSKILFYSWNEEVKKELNRNIKIKGQEAVAHVFISQNGRYIGLRKGIYEEGIGYTAEFEMYNDDGVELWQTDVSKICAGAYYISPNGEYFVAYGDPSGDYCDYLPSIWDKNGLRAELFPEGISDATAYWICDQIAFAEDGKKIGVIRTDQHNKNSTLYIFNDKGRQILKKEVGGWGYGWRSFKFSKSKGKIAIFIGGKDIHHGDICLYDSIGNLLWKIEGIKIGTPDFHFSSDEKTLAYINEWGLIYFIDLQKGRILWKFDETPDRIGCFRTLAASDDHRLLAIGVYGRYERHDRIFIFDKNGAMILEERFESGALGGIPAIKINSDNSEIIYRQGNKMVAERIRIIGR